MTTSPHTPHDLDLYLPRVPVIHGSEVARLMGFPTTEALYKAKKAGRLPIDLFQLPGRRGWFASTTELRRWLEHTLRGAAGPTEKAPS